jgi:hypothetical protein
LVIPLVSGFTTAIAYSAILRIAATSTCRLDFRVES